MEAEGLTKTSTNSRLGALNAVLPLFDPAHQKRLAVLIKIMEIAEVCRHYDALEVGAAQVRANDGAWRQKVITAMMPHVSAAHQNSLRTMLQILEMQEMFTIVK